MRTSQDSGRFNEGGRRRSIGATRVGAYEPFALVPLSLRTRAPPQPGASSHKIIGQERWQLCWRRTTPFTRRGLRHRQMIGFLTFRQMNGTYLTGWLFKTKWPMPGLPPLNCYAKHRSDSLSLIPFHSSSSLHISRDFKVMYSVFYGPCRLPFENLMVTFIVRYERPFLDIGPSSLEPAAVLHSSEHLRCPKPMKLNLIYKVSGI